MEVGDEDAPAVCGYFLSRVGRHQGRWRQLCVQFPDALKDLLLCHLIHTEWGIPIDGVRDECLVSFGEWVLLDEDGSVVVLVVRASNGDDL